MSQATAERPGGQGEPPLSEPLLALKGFTKSFGAVEALKDVDLELHAGEVLLVSGPSLSGKTTLVNVLAGWMAPDQGTVEWFGTPRAPGWADLTVVTQAFSLLQELTVEENVTVASRAAGATQDAAARAELLDRLGLGRLLQRLPSEISVGERQRVMVARSVVGGPHIVLADEPVSHQDDHHAGIVLEVLAEHAAAGSACLVAARGDARLRAVSDREQPLGASTEL